MFASKANYVRKELHLPAAVQSIILSFAPLFSKRVFDHARILIVGLS